MLSPSDHDWAVSQGWFLQRQRDMLGLFRHAIPQDTLKDMLKAV